MSSRRPGETSGIVAATHPALDAQAAVDGLAERGIVAAVRSGRLRVAPHFYNTEDEVARFMDELVTLAARRP